MVTTRDFFSPGSEKKKQRKEREEEGEEELKKRFFRAEEDSNFVLILSVEWLLSSQLPSVDFSFASALPSLSASDRFIRLGSEVQAGQGAGRKPVPRPLLRRPTRTDDGRTE